MGLFERNDYGRGYRGLDHGPGGRPRGAWGRFANRADSGTRRGYDRAYRGPHGGGYDAGDFAYRGLEGGWSTAFNRGAHDPQWDWRFAAGNRYDQDMEPPRRGYDRGYDRAFRSSPQPGRTRFGGVRREWRDAGGGTGRYDVEHRGEPAYPPRDFRGRGWGGR